MRKEIICIFVCALFLLSALTGAESTNILKNENPKESNMLTTETTTVWLKFFVHDECTKNVSQMVADCNDIFNGGDSGNRNGNGIVQFGTNGTTTTLDDNEFDNISTTAGRKTLLRKLKTEYENCSKGINVVIAPSGHFTANGYTYFNKGTGTNDKPFGGIILSDTCNQDQMNKTLAHELLHALGLSHEQVKWTDPDTGEIGSKPLGSTIVNGSGPGDDRELPAGSCGYPVPPHGYAYHDKDGDCDCEDDGEEQPQNDAGQKIWDIDGNCEFGDANDTGSLLWGRADRTNTTISPEQKEEIFDNANTTPGYRRQTTGQDIEVPQEDTTNSKSLKDLIGDAIKKFLDIIGGLITIYWEHNYIYFALELNALFPEDLELSYFYFLDTDNDLTTGNPEGYDYMIDLLVKDNYIASALSKWNYDYGIFLEVAVLPSNIAIGIEDSEDDEDCNELETEGMVIQWEVPIDLLELSLVGDMRISAVSQEGWSRFVDITSDVFISKERAIVPVLNLNPYNGHAGDSVTCYGYDFTPNSNVNIEFNGIYLTSTVTDDNGDFTTSFTVPPYNKGYYTVKAYDSGGKFHLRMFLVENQAPNKPYKPTGPNSGRPGTEYEYKSKAVDPDGDQIYYWFDWGDETNSGWVGPYDSDTEGSAKHTWAEQGYYPVKVKAKDVLGEESIWSDPLLVTMPRDKTINILLSKLFPKCLQVLLLLEQIFGL